MDFICQLYILFSSDLLIGKTCFSLIIKKISNGKYPFTNSNSQESQLFNQMRTGCILEANLLIFIRIILFYYFHYFFYILSKENEIYSDCSLKKSTSDFHIYGLNIIIILSAYVALFLGILCYMVKNKKVIVNWVIADFSIVWRRLFVIFYFFQIDYCLQFYMVLENFKI